MIYDEDYCLARLRRTITVTVILNRIWEWTKVVQISVIITERAILLSRQVEVPESIFFEKQ